MNTSKHASESQPSLNLITPFTTFDNGEPKPIPYVIDGLLTQGGFSILAGKPKQGKSSMARYEAVCVAKGIPFLGRETTRGEAILLSLEDPLNHVDNCLKALGWNPATDSEIHIVENLYPEIEKSIEAIRNTLAERPNVRLVIVDTLAKLLRVNDLNDYMVVLTAVEKLHNLAKAFPHVHIQGLAHSKKVRTDDVFDSLLGSTALRGEPDTTIALFTEKGQRVIATEARIGRNIEPTLLKAQLANSAGANVVGGFALEQTFSRWEESTTQKVEQKRRETHEERIISFLQKCESFTDSQEHLLNAVTGKRESLIAAIERLVDGEVLIRAGEKQSRTNPTKLTLNQSALNVYQLLRQFGGSPESTQ
jgi:hypothetical protein